MYGSSVTYGNFAHSIPLTHVLSATNNFAKENIIGKDASEKIYSGKLLWSGKVIDIVARRWLNRKWDHRREEFHVEISLLHSLKHKNLVSLVGYCDDRDEKIIIIKREMKGSLRNYLSDPMLLTWMRRLEISVSVAHALSYIHYDEKRDFSIIHRDIDSNAILLNDDWEPTLSISKRSIKLRASKRHLSFITDKVGNTPGSDPTYLDSNIVDHKSDLYSFGIVMFELLCGRKSLTDDQDNKYLGPVAIFHYKEELLDEIIDPVLWKQMDPQSFNVFAKTAYDCINEKRSQRPNIDEIVARLESTLKLISIEYADFHRSLMISRIDL